MTFRRLHIENYRGFRELTVDNLTRVNLLVGTNNSGKTSILEAIQALSTSGHPRALWSSMYRRGERTRSGDERVGWEADVCHLFHGHRLEPSSRFLIKGYRELDGAEQLIATVKERNSAKLVQGSLLEDAEYVDSSYNDDVPDARGSMELNLQWNKSPPVRLPMNSRGAVTSKNMIDLPMPRDSGRPVRFVTTAALGFQEILGLFEQVQLQPEERMVLDALKIVEPRIERIAPLSVTPNAYRYSTNVDRGGFIIKLEGEDHPIPIGSMGDGLWRLLGLSLALAKSENGILLVDEIDTGLHYSVMETMWKLVHETASRLNVQVFATTHSADCYQALGRVSEKAKNPDEISLHRVEMEADKSHVTSISGIELSVAANRELEVR